MKISAGGQTAPTYPASTAKSTTSQKTSGSPSSSAVPASAPLNTILAIGLMIALLWAGISLFRKQGAAKIVGGILLLILLADVMNTSETWLGYFNSFNKALKNGFTGLEALKNAGS